MVAELRGAFRPNCQRLLAEKS